MNNKRVNNKVDPIIIDDETKHEIFGQSLSFIGQMRYYIEWNYPDLNGNVPVHIEVDIQSDLDDPIHHEFHLLELYKALPDTISYRHLIHIKTNMDIIGDLGVVDYEYHTENEPEKAARIG